MSRKDPKQNGAKLPYYLVSNDNQRIKLSAGLPCKRITFLGLIGLVLLTIFGLTYRTSLEQASELPSRSSLSGSGSTSSSSSSDPLQRPRRPTPPVRTTILTLLPTTSTLPTPSSLTSTTTSSSESTSRFTSTTPAPTSSDLLPSVTTLRPTPLSSQRITVRPQDVSRYVSFPGGFADGRGLGNQIFCFAAVLYVAQLTGREPAIEKFKYVIELDKVFELNVERFDSLCPCSWVEESRHLAFDEETDKKVLINQESANKSILVGGFRQSWRYTLAVERRLRRHLVFKEEKRKFAEEFLEKNIPAGWNRAGFLRVAIHIRRGDILEQRLIDYGYTVPNRTYFEKAMRYFTDRYRRVQFITFSQDQKWTTENIYVDANQTQSVNVTPSFGHSPGQDMAIMSMCDHVIMSTGTFGWWGGWLAKGTTIYYSDWPRNGSGLQQQFIREDFFPPNWIPMTD